MIKKFLGVLMLIIALTGLAISAFGIVTSRQLFGNVGRGLEDTLTIASDSLGTVKETLLLTKTTVGQVEGSLVTVGDTAIELSDSISNTEPLLDQVTQVATQDVPESLEAIENAIPDIAEAAGAIDDTLRLLDAFQLDRQIFGVPIRFDLGVDYKPEENLDETVNQLGAGLDGVPESLRGLETNMATVSLNLSNIGGNILTISEDLENINERVGEIEPLIDDYIELIEETNLLVNDTKSNIAQFIDAISLITMVLFIWMGLNQIVPLYLAWTIFVGKNDDEPEEGHDNHPPLSPDESSIAGSTGSM